MYNKCSLSFCVECKITELKTKTQTFSVVIIVIIIIMQGMAN